jgi:hypothetical protein
MSKFKKTTSENMLNVLRTTCSPHREQLGIGRPDGQKRKGNDCHQEDAPKKPTPAVFGKPA